MSSSSLSFVFFKKEIELHKHQKPRYNGQDRETCPRNFSFAKKMHILAVGIKIQLIFLSHFRKRLFGIKGNVLPVFKPIIIPCPRRYLLEQRRGKKNSV
jgi:hypothetical protein